MNASPGVPLSRAGGLPPDRSPLEAAKPKLLGDATQDLGTLSPSLASILRPQAAYRWLLPYLASITPQYIESVLRGALAGNHVQAWELFDLMMDTDPEISSCVQEYTEGVLAKKFVFEPYHEEDEEPSDLAKEKCKLVSAALRGMRPDMANDENDLSNTARDILAARFHGQSVLEVDWHTPEGELNIRQVPNLGNVLLPRSTFWVHPVCYAWDMNGRLGLRMALTDLQNQTKDATLTKLGKVKSMVEPPAWSWITSQPRPSLLQDFPINKFLIGIHKAKTGSVLSASCLRPLAWWWCASNFCGDWLLNYAQLFGIPFRKGKYAPNTPEPIKQEIRQMLQSCGSAGYILLPSDVELEFMETGGGSSNSPQAFLFNFADSQKRKVILHQTMTGGSHDSMGKGGGKAFGEVEDDTKSQCIGAGAKNVASVINLQLIPMLLSLNYGEDGDLEAPTCKLVDVEVGGLADAQRDAALVQIMDVPDSYLHRKYGIPKPSDEDEIAGQDVGVLGAQAQAQAKAQKDQADAAKASAAAMAKQSQDAKEAKPGDKAAGEGGDGETGQQDPNEDKGKGAEARVAAGRKALEAATAKTSGAGCLMAMINDPLAGKLIAWAAENVDEKSLTADGLEQEPHVTVLYGFDIGFEAEQIKKLLNAPISIELGKLSRFECEKYDVLKFDIDCPELENLHKKIAGQFEDEITPSEHTYHPHLTVAYVKKGTNKDLDGSEFEGETCEVSMMVYSEPDNTNRLRFFIGPGTARTVLESSRAIKAASAPPGVESAATALHGVVEPMLDRLTAIQAIKDKATRVKMLNKFLKDHEAITAAMVHDDSLAKAITPQLVEQFIKGLKNKKAST